jgi:gamma-glutamyltranspeptidase/glutathione hydrolase
MVCAIDHLAAHAGLEMLRAGGSAADAAVATSAVLAVTSQHLCGLGGDLLAMVAPPGTDPIALNSSGRAGSGADPERLRAAGNVVMPFRDDISVVTVPGCVDGWLALHERFGELALADVLEPARRYAEEGFPASPTLVTAFDLVQHLPDAADYLEAGPLRPGTIIRRPGVARTLAAIARGGRAAFYGGEFGAGLIEVGGGQFSPEDLATPLANWTEPLAADAFGARLWTVPPNSSGYLTLAGAAIADGMAFPADHDDAQAAYLLVEAARQAGQDRLAVLYEGADVAWLLDPDEIARRRSGIDPAKAAVLGDGYRPGGTIALVAVDQNRLGISILQSNASGFGSHIIEPRTRIFLHNRGIGFSLEPGHPGEYGPGRRPASTLCPTVVTAPDGTLRGVLGTMGGDSQPQILLQLLHRWLVGGDEPGDALAAGRWTLLDPTGGGTFDTWNHRGHVSVTIEANAPASWARGLRARGHEVLDAEPYSGGFGHAHLIAVEDETLAGGTDPRPRFGAVAAY